MNPEHPAPHFQRKFLPVIFRSELSCKKIRQPLNPADAMRKEIRRRAHFFWVWFMQGNEIGQGKDHFSLPSSAIFICFIEIGTQGGFAGFGREKCAGIESPHDMNFIKSCFASFNKGLSTAFTQAMSGRSHGVKLAVYS